MSDFGNKTVFAANLQWYMDKQQIDRNQLCADLGFKYPTVSDWLSARKYPRIDKIETLARYFGVQKSALIETDGSRDRRVDFPISSHEIKVITAYRDKPTIQPIVDKILDVEPESGRVIPLTAADRNVSPLRSPLKIGGRIPVLGKIPAGVPIKAVQDIIDEIDVSPEMTRDGHSYFGLLVTGDSMIPEFRSGDYVIVRQQPTAENGDIVAAYVGGDNATLKRYHRSESGITLEALNPDYESRTFSPEEVDTLPLTIAGVVVEQRRNKQPAGHSPVTRVAAYDGSDDQPAFPTPDDLDTAPDLEL